MPSDPLARVRRAAANKRRGEQEFVSALKAAYASGVSYGQLGRLLGVSRQAVRQMVERNT